MVDVTVFSSAGCGKCVATKANLRKRGIPFREVRVDQVEGARASLQRAGLSTLPVVLAYRHEGDEVPDYWSDYHPDFIDSLLDPRMAIPEPL